MDGFKEFHLVETEIFSYTLKRLPSTVGAECSRDRGRVTPAGQAAH